MKCIVCEADKASYRCRTCRSAYCSSKCYKKHRMPRAEAAAEVAQGNATTSSLAYLCETVVVAQLPEMERPEKRRRAEAEADVFLDTPRERAAAAHRSEHDAPPSSTPPSVEDSAKTATEVSEENETVGAGPQPPAPEEYAGDAGAVYTLQEKHLCALERHPRVRSALCSPSLQKLIKTIDSSRSRLDALEAAQYNNADFKEFCIEVIRVIAEVEGR
ncbi:putative HIT zinc finger containing protein [Leishmania utingensis]|uniref:HIT zinc finger containing protein n=1 Tax=Leishmania utingensis TaxID=653362 RepID=A0AAW3A1D8_9TRYP